MRTDLSDALKSQEAVDELFESQLKTIDEALGLIKHRLRKEIVENCAP